MTFQLNQFLLAVSDCLDFVEIDILGATSNHSKRVAYISLLLAEEFGMDENERYDLCSYAILHDNGLCQEVVNDEAKHDAPQHKRTNLETYRVHCQYGEENVRRYPFLTGQQDIIRYHHENYDGSGYFGIKGEDIPLMAQIITLADTVDNMFHFEKSDVENRTAIKAFINKNEGRYYSPEMVAAFKKVSAPTAFWLNLQEPYLYTELEAKTPSHALELSLDEIYEITNVFSKIVDSKSVFTARHSSGLEEKTEVMSDFYGFDDTKKKGMMIAATLHDLGKLAISNAILDKPGKLDEAEMETMRSHTYYTAKALQQIDGFERISKWAANHHEKLDGSGYPFGYDAAVLGFEERLMGCLDMYQALTEDRPYREGMGHERALSILREQAQRGFIDGQIVDDIANVFHGQSSTRP